MLQHATDPSVRSMIHLPRFSTSFALPRGAEASMEGRPSLLARLDAVLAKLDLTESTEDAGDIGALKTIGIFVGILVWLLLPPPMLLRPLMGVSLIGILMGIGFRDESGEARRISFHSDPVPSLESRRGSRILV